MGNLRVFIAFLVTALAVSSPPPALDCRYVVFTAPAPGATLSGMVEVRGSARVVNFQFYKVEYSLLGRNGWTLIGTDVVRQPVENGRLVLWQTTTVPDETYQLRLHVVDTTGNYCEATLSPVTIANVRATVPLPEPTETEVLTAVPPGPTLTVRPTVSVDVPPVQNTPGALPTPGSPWVPSVSDVMGVVGFFLLGICLMSVIVFAILVALFIRYLRVIS